MAKVDHKVVLVTGGTGFVGGHLVEALLARHAKVIVPFRSINPFSYFATQKLNEKVMMVTCDIKNKERVFEIVTKHEVDYIFHLAAQPIVLTAYGNPLETILTNVIGTANILETVRCYPHIRGIVVASSDKAYGKLKKTYIETDPLRGDHPYEVSKSAADMLCNTYYKTYQSPVVITRFGNIYGAGDLHFSRIIPGLMQAMVEDSEFIVRSNGKYVRDYIYVKDVAQAYLFLMERLGQTKGQAFNIASRDTYAVKELIAEVQKILRKPVRYRITDSAVNEIPEQHLVWSKIYRLGWKPAYSLKTALPQVYQWYEQYIQTQKI